MAELKANSYKVKRYRSKRIPERKYTKLGYSTERVGKYFLVDLGGSSILYRGASYSSNKGLIASQIADNKFITKEIIKKHGVMVPRGKLFHENEKDRARRYLKKLEGAVIKPEDGHKGKGVTIGVNLDNFDYAWASAVSNSKSKKVIVEQMFEGIYVRALVVNGRCIAVLKVSEPNVIGDGKNSIESLIEEKNKKRLLNPHLKRGLIEINEHRLSILKDQGYMLKSVPKKGKYVVLDKLANCAAGSDSYDITNKVHPMYKKLAETATKAIPGLDVAGLDFLIKDPSTKPAEDNYVIIEINRQPALAGHLYPFYGKPRKVIDFIVNQDLKRTNALKTINDLPNTNKSLNPIPLTSIYDLKYNCYNEKIEDGALIRNEFARRGFNSKKVGNYRLYLICSKWVAFRKAISSNLSIVSHHLIQDDFFQRKFLELYQIHTQQGRFFEFSDKESAFQYWSTLKCPCIKVANKALPQENNFATIWQQAVLYGEKNKLVEREGVLIEEQRIRGKKAKYLVVNHHCVSICQYEPANIEGNDEDSISCLVMKNLLVKCEKKSIEMNESALSNIVANTVSKLGYVEDYVPYLGQEINYYYETNNRDWHDSYAIYDHANPELRSVAENASRILPGLDIVSVEIVAESHIGNDNNVNYFVTDIDTQPAIAEFQYPKYGEPTNVAKDIVDYIMNWAYREKLVSELMD